MLPSAWWMLRSLTVFLDWAIVFILTNDIIIQKSQTINPVGCCHGSVLIGKLEYGFKRPGIGEGWEE